MDVLKAYWEKLTTSGVSPQDYTFEQCVAHYKAGLDRWLWLFPLLATFNYNTKYFHDKIDSFLEDHSPDATSFPIVSVVEIFDSLIPHPEQK